MDIRAGLGDDDAPVNHERACTPRSQRTTPSSPPTAATASPCCAARRQCPSLPTRRCHERLAPCCAACSSFASPWCDNYHYNNYCTNCKNVSLRCSCTHFSSQKRWIYHQNQTVNTIIEQRRSDSKKRLSLSAMEQMRVVATCRNAGTMTTRSSFKR